MKPCQPLNLMAAIALSSGFAWNTCVADDLTSKDDTNWIRIQLDARFRSEGVSAADFNNDGAMDVAAGDVLYLAPQADTDATDSKNWTRRDIREPGDFVAGKGYSNSFANTAWDMNQDGLVDQVIIGFPGDPFHWYENPGDSDQLWKQHVIWNSACNESPEFEDLNGDGTPEFILGSQPESVMAVISIPTKDQTQQIFPMTSVSQPSQQAKDAKRRGTDNGTFKYSHGLGIGDVNTDGLADIIITKGWWEAPKASESQEQWAFHPFGSILEAGDSAAKSESLPDAANIYADDLDSDGDADLFLSSAHKFGVWWAENKGDAQWVLHEIDKSYSQTHAVEQVDVNGDGQLDYITGKRFFAHNGNDPGGNDEVDMYWYEVKRSQNTPPVITRHRIVAGHDTGVGTQFQIQDMNQDGKPDIVLSNKKGVNVLLQK
ncbi:MAG: FG-GAP-like repeat-containing protein [Fuerstiella sp.]